MHGKEQMTCRFRIDKLWMCQLEPTVSTMKHEKTLATNYEPNIAKMYSKKPTSIASVDIPITVI